MVRFKLINKRIKMCNKKRVTLIVKEWFQLKTGVCLEQKTLNTLVDDITETKQCVNCETKI